VLAATARRTNDKHPRAGFGGNPHLLADSGHGVAFADELANVESVAELVAERQEVSMQSFGSQCAFRSGRRNPFRDEDEDEQEVVGLIFGGQRHESRGAALEWKISTGEPADGAIQGVACECFRGRAEGSGNLGERLVAACVVIAALADKLSRLDGEPCAERLTGKNDSPLPVQCKQRRGRILQEAQERSAG
jgi:hypothetical protein